MLKPRREPDLAKEALLTQYDGKVRVQDLESNEPVMADVSSQVHRGHAAATQLPLDHIAVTQGFLELEIVLGHRTAREG
jgi:hypothetical protein